MRRRRACPGVREEPGRFRNLRRADRSTWPIGNCAHCGSAFPRSQRSHQYCSARCRSAAFSGRRRPASVSAACDFCDVTFLKKRRDQRFCSRRCRIRQTSRLAYRRDPERALTRWRNWYARNRESFKAYVREWRRDNPDRRALYERRRRAARVRAIGRHSLADVLALFEAYDWRCAYCGSDKALTVDHRVPLSRGGDDSVQNLIPACPSCNSSKHDRTELEFQAWQALLEFVRGRARNATMTARGAARRTTGGRA